uniref:Uncharacterized protein n=1 Tax=Porodaedalea pini TaxID=108901 RepID=A0A5B9RJX4_9AGAM|nr:hypothetical protein PPIT_000139 [Porodaedalea pini]QEG57035.1 hypothetical protein PPIT_000139 [Porodaedalea pini]
MKPTLDLMILDSMKNKNTVVEWKFYSDPNRFPGNMNYLLNWIYSFVYTYTFPENYEGLFFSSPIGKRIFIEFLITDAWIAAEPRGYDFPVNQVKFFYTPRGGIYMNEVTKFVNTYTRVVQKQNKELKFDHDSHYAVHELKIIIPK